MTKGTPIANRHDIVVLFEVVNGNPNGDPDAGNMPRMDPETGHGLVSDVSLKRKIRNYVEMTREGVPGDRIYVTEGAVLNEKHREAYLAKRPDDAGVAKASKLTPKSDEEAKAIRDFMCENFYDIRTFGGVLSTGINAGQVRGPVQFAFARSAEPILPLEVSITRMAATNEQEKKQRVEGETEDDSEKRGDKRTMGRKHIVPYGLYRAHGFVSAKVAEKTGFSEEDLDLLLAALEEMFEHDHSAARGEMATRKLIIFRHDNALGRAPAHALFDRIRIGRAVDGEFREIDARLDNLAPARSFTDYAVTIDREGLPQGIEIIER
ncbi:type I-C CRISPR-associated protein Cas7/Csd2 [Acuticoccus mangrovi]|uniref:Type I-C CRISPR-associated protein Cas7/Csd2 n=1 Tax=Acuticoccus mangrovi TaxID=2796142 RepID=A0A934IUF7_9HYPH|nr:type I-C CRISPR-associated protein Cas7/Csd2 [Acuticoccus mangrovi]MBJ3777939.1 type I-C CRISPR-associated protein Cas7/Csd2 [Acuticoccus mangrovi]